MTDDLRVVWLFGRPYWWDLGNDGRLTLRPVHWRRDRLRRRS
ncbi:hypothetical protein ACFWIB_15370 [Streptomyces sp. NPDC127051]